MKKTIIAIIAVIVILAGIYLFESQKDKMGREFAYTEISIMSETMNTASVSATADDDIVGYSGDPTASLSVGERILVSGAADLTENYNYFVKTASAGSGFEIASTSGGPVIDLATDFVGGETFYQAFAGKAFDVSNYTYSTLAVNAETSPSCSLKFVGSISNSVPDFLLSQSSTNKYEYVDVNDIQNATEVEGDTGLEFAGTADHRMFKVYAEALHWLSVITSGKCGAGSITATAFGAE